MIQRNEDPGNFIGSEEEREYINQFREEFPEAEDQNQEEIEKILYTEELDNWTIPTPLHTLDKDIEQKEERLRQLRQEVRNLGQKKRGLQAEIDVYTKTARKGRKTTFSVFDRYPPHNIEMERAILGLYLQNPELMGEFNQPYLNKMFYAEAHTLVHRGMMDLELRLTTRNLGSQLEKHGTLEAVGGMTYLVELEASGKAEDPKRIDDYLREVEERFLAREGIVFCGDKASKLYLVGYGDEIPSVTEFIRRATTEMLNIIPFRFRTSRDMNSITDEVSQEFVELVARGGKPKVSTGYKSLDRVLHGIIPNRLVMIGGRTKVGKTTLTLNVANNVAEQGSKVMIFSFESSKYELVQKLLAKYSGLDSEAFVYHDQISQEQIEAVERAKVKVKKLPILIEDGKPDIDYIVHRARAVKVADPSLALVIIDGLQSFDGYIPYQGNKSDVYSEILKKAKAQIAKELGITVIVNAQLKQDIEKRKDKRPRGLEDFSDCKGIPEVADSALLLYRPEFYWPDKPEYQGWMSVIPAAMRVGDKRNKGLRFGVNLVTAEVYEPKG